ncbi:dienelactone hydrolase family protein [Bradyrhizobium sp. Arg237L]|uniref:dienelactone hydrolase family protein n=1 Tax=Bradyrhizobium sp. Arg237L TaxID=3003352 RepID=UPI00249F347E|nr:dienelactone hydrolase family protein [Bradyrhizobium sp. Arg237L]MDI4235221.1 dienelactone hydrolase family protein [Bradyrhizobium sp. Arg237L]
MAAVSKSNIIAFFNCIALAFGLLLALISTARAQEKVSFPSTDSDLTGGTPTIINGYLYRPSGPGPFAAVVSVHGCDGAANEKGEVRPLYGTWGEVLSQKGYVVLLIDSFQPRGHGSLCALLPVFSRPILPNRETPRDAFGAMNYLRSRSDVRSGSIAIFGQSYGGMAMLFTIANGALPKDVPPEKDFRAAIAIYPNCPPVADKDPHWRPRQPMLLLMGESDSATPPGPCKDMVARAKDEGSPPIDMHFYPNTHHAFDHPNLPLTQMISQKRPDGSSPTIGANPEARADAINRVTQFLARELK